MNICAFFSHIHVNSYEYIHIYIYIHTHISKEAYIYTYAYMSLYICKYIHFSICKHVCMYIYTPPSPSVLKWDLIIATIRTLYSQILRTDFSIQKKKIEGSYSPEVQYLLFFLFFYCSILLHIFVPRKLSLLPEHSGYTMK
jgi:hypothetical protein